MSIHVHDTLPEDHEYLTYIKKVLRHLFRQAGYRRISTPAFEVTEVFKKAYGEKSEYFRKHIHTFKDHHGNVLSLKPESTVAIARAYLSNAMDELPQPVELYFVDTFYRYEGEENNFMEHLDYGVQVLGASDPALDAQIIYLAKKIMDELGLSEHFTIHINHIGSAESRKVFEEDVKNFYFDKTRSLCEKCIRLVESNPLQLYRCKEEDCSILAQLAPKLENYTNEEGKENYAKLKEYLEELRVHYVENMAIVGDFSFHTGTRFEIWDNNKGNENILMKGGDVENLTQLLDAEEDILMAGFEGSMAEMVKSMKECGITVPKKDHLQVFVAQLGIGAKKKTLKLLEDLRDSGIQTVGAIGTGSMRVQLDLAQQFGVKYTLLMGEMEVKSGMVIMRDMSVGTQESVPYDKVIEMVQERIGRERVDLMEDKEKSKELRTEKR
jgi:histidyl-tRNA synthetase